MKTKRLVAGWWIGVFLSLVKLTTAETEHHLSSIFCPTGSGCYCALECPGKHTLCERPGDPAKSPERCTNFQELLGSPQLWQNILNAHNGIRDRFAGRSRISNMRKLVWDDELARMARLHLASCERYESDPCTQLQSPSVSERNYRNVRQNKAFMVERYLPRYYALDVLRDWYQQKQRTARPLVVENRAVYQHELNNFTLLTWASLERLGCAAAKYRDGFQLVCNYFPFYSIKEPSGLVGLPATQCPRTFPLRSRVFAGLCTFEMDEVARLNPPSFVMVLGASLMLLKFAS